MVTTLFENGLVHSEEFNNIVKEISENHQGEHKLQAEVVFALLEFFADAQDETQAADDKFINFVHNNSYMYFKDLTKATISGMASALYEHWKDDRKITLEEIETGLNALINYICNKTNGTSRISKTASEVTLGIRKIEAIINSSANKKAEA